MYRQEGLPTSVLRGQIWALCMAKDTPCIYCTGGKMKSDCLQAVCLRSSLPYLASPTGAHTPLVLAKEQSFSSLNSSLSLLSVVAPSWRHRTLYRTWVWVLSTTPRVTPVLCTSSLFGVGIYLEGQELESLGGAENRGKGLAAPCDVLEEGRRRVM